MKKKYVFRRKDTIFEFFIEFEKDVKFPYLNLTVNNNNTTKFVCIYLTGKYIQKAWQLSG
ncbi:MAG: hypothetical protein SOW32_00560 [Agathobacter sp.]|nr:hypothetical protein [Agathobacter sp.]